MPKIKLGLQKADNFCNLNLRRDLYAEVSYNIIHIYSQLTDNLVIVDNSILSGLLSKDKVIYEKIATEERIRNPEIWQNILKRVNHE